MAGGTFEVNVSKKRPEIILTSSQNVSRVLTDPQEVPHSFH